MDTTYPVLTSRKCSECGSFLLLTDKRTEQVEGQYAPVTTCTYQCSNKECHENFVKQTAKRLKLQKEQEQAKLSRIQNLRLKRKKTA